MGQAKTELLVEQLKMARFLTLKLADEVPEERRLVQMKEGKATPMWLLGHLANTLNTLCVMWIWEEPSLVSKEYAKQFAPDFAQGNPITTNPEDYPSWDEVKETYKTCMAAVIEHVEKLQDEELPKEMSAKMPAPFKEYFSSWGRTLCIMVDHDAHHRGQMALIAKL